MGHPHPAGWGAAEREKGHHLDHLQQVLQILLDNHLFAKSSKCSFGVTIVEYLGHIITDKGVSLEGSKLQSLLSWPTPQSVRAVRRFLGLTGYYRKFIRNYGLIAAPLTQLLKKDKFHWTTSAEAAFLKLKNAMTSAPVLALPDFSKTFVIECDASSCGMDAVLMQDGRPIAYLSMAFNTAQLGLSTYEKEMEAILFAVRKWRPYLTGRQFIIRTNHQSLRYLLTQKVHTPAQQRWLVKLLGYNFQLEYKYGHHNKAADALSRVFEDSTCLSISVA